MNEYHTVMHILMAKPQNDLMRCYLMPSLTKFQFHMIGRVDDCSQFSMESFTTNPDNDFMLQANFVGQRMLKKRTRCSKPNIDWSDGPYVLCVIGTGCVARGVSRSRWHRGTNVIYFWIE